MIDPWKPFDVSFEIEDFKNLHHVVMFSGGAASYATAKRIIEWYGHENTTLLFSDTKTEDPDLYRFMADAEKVLAHEVTKISYGLNIWELFREQRFLGNNRVDVCSRILKRELCDKWISERYQPDQVIVWVGIDIFEAGRLVGAPPTANKKAKAGLAERKLPYLYRSAIMHKPLLLKQDCLDMLKTDGIELPLLYKLGFEHNNCAALCVKAGIAHWVQVYHQLPDSDLVAENEEQAIREYLGKDVAILRDRSGKSKGQKTRPLTLRELRHRIEKQQSGMLALDFEDSPGGCGCMIDDYEEDEEDLIA